MNHIFIIFKDVTKYNEKIILFCMERNEWNGKISCIVFKMSENIGNNMILVIKFHFKRKCEKKYNFHFYLVFNLFDNIGNKIKTK